MATTVKLTTTISRTYGAVTASWGMECTVSVNSRSDILKEYARLHDHIRAEMIDFESATLPRLPAPAPDGLPEANAQRPAAEWHPLVEIFVEVKKGAKFYYAKTSSGKHMRFGAPLYFDNFKGLTETEFDERAKDGSIKYDPMQCRVLIREKNGKHYAIAFATKDEIDA